MDRASSSAALLNSSAFPQRTGRPPLKLRRAGTSRAEPGSLQRSKKTFHDLLAELRGNQGRPEATFQTRSNTQPNAHPIFCRPRLQFAARGHPKNTKDARDAGARAPAPDPGGPRTPCVSALRVVLPADLLRGPARWPSVPRMTLQHVATVQQFRTRCGVYLPLLGRPHPRLAVRRRSGSRGLSRARRRRRSARRGRGPDGVLGVSAPDTLLRLQRQWPHAVTEGSATCDGNRVRAFAKLLSTTMRTFVAVR